MKNASAVNRCARSSIRFLFAVITVLACFYPQASNADACLEDNGKFQCRDAIPITPWAHDLCDDWGTYIAREAAWCVVLGGTWNSTWSSCDGALTPVTEGNASGLAQAFEEKIHDPRCFGGWPPPPANCSNYNCTCRTVTIAGALAEDYSLLPFSGRVFDGNGCSVPGWAENIVHKITRDVGCPAGFLEFPRLSGHFR